MFVADCCEGNEINRDSPERRNSKERFPERRNLDCTSTELTMSGAVGREGFGGEVAVP